MPLNTTTFLVSQGWEGVGLPLDGKAGKGLKKPLAITQKKTLSGIGKDRDRADDWWNSIFTAGAKSLSIGPSPASSGASTPTLDKSKEPTTSTSWNMGERSAASTTMSLSSLAKREHARKTLMSNFVRGKPIVPAEEPPAMSALKAEGSKVVAASDTEAQAALDVTSPRSGYKSETKSKSKSKSKEKGKDKDDERLARKLAKRALRKQQEATTTTPTKSSKKRKREATATSDPEPALSSSTAEKKKEKAKRLKSETGDAVAETKTKEEKEERRKRKKDKKGKKEKKEKKETTDKKEKSDKKIKKDRKEKKEAITKSETEK